MRPTMTPRRATGYADAAGGGWGDEQAQVVTGSPVLKSKITGVASKSIGWDGTQAWTDSIFLVPVTADSNTRSIVFAADVKQVPG